MTNTFLAFLCHRPALFFLPMLLDFSRSLPVHTSEKIIHRPLPVLLTLSRSPFVHTFWFPDLLANKSLVLSSRPAPFGPYPALSFCSIHCLDCTSFSPLFDLSRSRKGNQHRLTPNSLHHPLTDKTNPPDPSASWYPPTGPLLQLSSPLHTANPASSVQGQVSSFPPLTTVNMRSEQAKGIPVMLIADSPDLSPTCLSPPKVSSSNACFSVPPMRDGKITSKSLALVLNTACPCPKQSTIILDIVACSGKKIGLRKSAKFPTSSLGGLQLMRFPQSNFFPSSPSPFLPSSFLSFQSQLLITVPSVLSSRSRWLVPMPHFSALYHVPFFLSTFNVLPLPSDTSTLRSYNESLLMSPEHLLYPLVTQFSNLSFRFHTNTMALSPPCYIPPSSENVDPPAFSFLSPIMWPAL
jgi:hypothetical protein